MNNAQKDFILCDLDGTLANPDKYLHLVQGKNRDYVAFHKASEDFELNKWCYELLKSMFEQGYMVMFVSARPKAYLTETRNWLHKYFYPWTQAYSIHLVRDDGDTTQDYIIKRDWLKRQGVAHRVLFALDDRGQVARMWRKEGLICLQCDHWEEKAQASKGINPFGKDGDSYKTTGEDPKWIK